MNKDEIAKNAVAALSGAPEFKPRYWTTSLSRMLQILKITKNYLVSEYRLDPKKYYFCVVTYRHFSEKTDIRNSIAMYKKTLFGRKYLDSKGEFKKSNWDQQSCRTWGSSLEIKEDLEVISPANVFRYIENNCSEIGSFARQNKNSIELIEELNMNKKLLRTSV